MNPWPVLAVSFAPSASPAAPGQGVTFTPTVSGGSGSYSLSRDIGGQGATSE